MVFGNANNQNIRIKQLRKSAFGAVSYQRKNKPPSNRVWIAFQKDQKIP